MFVYKQVGEERHSKISYNEPRLPYYYKEYETDTIKTKTGKDIPNTQNIQDIIDGLIPTMMKLHYIEKERITHKNLKHILTKYEIGVVFNICDEGYEDPEYASWYGRFVYICEDGKIIREPCHIKDIEPFDCPLPDRPFKVDFSMYNHYKQI